MKIKDLRIYFGPQGPARTLVADLLRLSSTQDCDGYSVLVAGAQQSR